MNQCQRQGTGYGFMIGVQRDDAVKWVKTVTRQEFKLPIQRTPQISKQHRERGFDGCQIDYTAGWGVVVDEDGIRLFHPTLIVICKRF